MDQYLTGHKQRQRCRCRHQQLHSRLVLLAGLMLACLLIPAADAAKPRDRSKSGRWRYVCIASSTWPPPAGCKLLRAVDQMAQVKRHYGSVACHNMHVSDVLYFVLQTTTTGTSSPRSCFVYKGRSQSCSSVVPAAGNGMRQVLHAAAIACFQGSFMAGRH